MLRHKKIERNNTFPPLVQQTQNKKRQFHFLKIPIKKAFIFL